MEAFDAVSHAAVQVLLGGMYGTAMERLFTSFKEQHEFVRDYNLLLRIPVSGMIVYAGAASLLAIMPREDPMGGLWFMMSFVLTQPSLIRDLQSADYAQWNATTSAMDDGIDEVPQDS